MLFAARPPIPARGRWWATRGDPVTPGDNQVAWVRELVSHEVALDGDKPAMAGWLQRMCRAAVRDLPAMGVGISLLSEGSDPVAVAASSEESAVIEELQFAMAEGPCIDAVASRIPVLVPDLSATASATWPGYAPAAHDHGVRAVFAFPLQIGSVQLGALDVYRDDTGSLSEDTLVRALTFAEVALQELLDAGERPGDAVDAIEDATGNHFEIYQAQGMVMVQLGVSAREALARLRAHAYTHDQRLRDVARDVIERRLSLESDT